MKTETRLDWVWRLISVAAIAVSAETTGIFRLNAQETNTPKSATESPKAETPVEYDNWLDLSVGSFFVDGDKAQFQKRRGQPAGPFGGIEDFHWEMPVQKRGLFSVDGRGIFDNHDYLLKLQLSHPDKGYVQFGYREFRTWYDGSGGFFPGNGQWFSLYDDQMYMDRGQLWFEAGLRMPHKSELTFRYEHDFRHGEKDSTVWGDTSLTDGAGFRGIVPSFWSIDEQRDSFALDLKHKISKTDWGVGVRYELLDNGNARNMRRQPESGDGFVTQRDKVETDLFNAHAFTETRFNEKVLLTSGYSFTTLDTDLGGSRIYGSDYEAIYDPGSAFDTGFLNLSGGSQLKQYVFNLNLMWLLKDRLTLVPSVRVEHVDEDGFSSFLSTPDETPYRNTNQRGFTDVSEALELRYTGVTNWVFYARGEWLEGQGNLQEQQNNTDPNAPAVTLFRDTHNDRLTQKYLVGANWYPRRQLNLAAQYYHKVRQNDYSHRADSTPNIDSGDRYPAYLTAQDFETDDVNVRATWRPLNNLTLVSRYDFQLSTVDTKADSLAQIQSAEMTSHILSESISWSPLARLYLQGSVNYVLDHTETPANDLTGGAAKLVPKSRNDYWNATATTGYALDNKTDLQAQYFYYRADNYVDNSAVSQPYGAGAEAHGVTAALSRQITPRLRWTLKYAFFRNRDETSGGHNDFDGHGVYSSMQFRF
jgi:hypothetical protein